MPSSQQIAEAAISGLSALIILSLLLLAVCNFNRKNGCRYTSFMMSFVATGVLYIIYNLLKCYTALAPDSVIAQNLQTCQLYWQCYQFYIFGKFGMYLFYSTRVFQTFKGSAFELSQRHYKILMLSITIYYISISVAFVAEVSRWGDFDTFPMPDEITNDDGVINTWQDCVYHTDYWAAQMGMIIKIIFLYSGETFFGVVLLRLYVRKVLLLLETNLKFRDIEVSMNSVRTVSRTATGDRNSRTGSGNSTQDAHDDAGGSASVDDAFLQVAVKSTNLYLFSWITSLFAGTLFDAVGRWLLDIDTVVNYFCMYLTFVFAKQWYGIMCYGTHKCCWSVCVASVFKCCMMDCCACDCGPDVRGNADMAQELSTAVDMGKPQQDASSETVNSADAKDNSNAAKMTHVHVSTQSELPGLDTASDPPPETR